MIIRATIKAVLFYSSTHLFADVTSSVVGCCIGAAPADWVRIELEATSFMQPWVNGVGIGPDIDPDRLCASPFEPALVL